MFLYALFLSYPKEGFLVGLIRDNFSDCWLLLIGRAFYAKQIMFEVCNQTSRNVERKFGNAQKRNAEK